MAALAFQDDGKGRLSLSGVLGFDTVSAALPKGIALFGEHKRIVVDLGGVEGTDSAGLALLVEWTGWAKREKRKLSFKHVPEQALALARISEVDKILPLG